MLNRNKLTQLLILGALMAMFSCQSKSSEAQESSTLNDASDAEIQVMLEGELYVTEKVDWHSSHANVVNNQIQFLLWDGEDPVQLNFNIHKDVLGKGASTYTIPEANDGKIIIDLNFFNKDREVSSRMNKRIVFRKGKIDITELSDRTLVMSFEGEGSGMMERDKSFPISGKVDVSY